MKIIPLFQKLLQYKSITPDDAGIYDFIDEYLGDTWQCIKLDIEDVTNRFYYKKFTESEEHLCFAGHVDVVPTGEGWSVDPFAAEVIDGVITARGAQDMKSGVASFLYACKNATNFNGTLSILLTSDEEGEGTYGTIKVLEYLKEKNFLPSSAIVAEPTCEEVFGDAIKVGRRGSINGYLEVKGKQGHAAYPEKAINPVHLVSPILPQVAGYNLDNGDEFFSPSKFIITDIRSGMEVTNVTPNKLNMMFNVRNSTKTNQESITKFIAEKFQDLDYTLRLTQGSYPFVTNEDTKVVKVMQNSIQSICNMNTKLSTAGGTSDARLFGQFKIPTVEFGVKNDTIHAINERTTVKEVEKLAEVFENIIKTW
ncbi:succinyl-diaminopimelate desuccinylase [Arcobacter sp. 15-2]|uniref:succinyl-diaminopimelate desuccinylase n=1 Tax=Arcobacter sp. 15-2 TaxID=3374109 RepID=UPI00399D1140